MKKYNQEAAEHRKQAKPRQKIREPAEERQFTKSYLFETKKNP